MGDVAAAPEEGGEEEGDEECSECIDVESADGTDVRIERDKLANERTAGDQEVVDPRNMKRNRSGKEGGEGKRFVDAVAEEVEHSSTVRLSSPQAGSLQVARSWIQTRWRSRQQNSQRSREPRPHDKVSHDDPQSFHRRRSRS